MTFFNRQGSSNVLDTVKIMVANRINDQIAIANNNSFCYLNAYDLGDYSIDTDTEPLLLETNEHSLITIPIAGTGSEDLDAAAMVARINETLGDGSAYDLLAVAVDDTFIIRKKTAGESGWINLLPSSSNSLFGWHANGFMTNYETLKNIMNVEIGFENTLPQQFPGIVIMLDSDKGRGDRYIVDYQITARVYDTNSAMPYGNLYRSLADYAWCIQQVFETVPPTGSMINDIQPTDASINNSLLTNDSGTFIGSYADVTAAIITTRNC